MSIALDKGLDEWLQSSPQIIRDLHDKLPCNKVYRIKSTNQLGVIWRYGENGTVTLAIIEPSGIEVFGLKPEQLEMI